MLKGATVRKGKHSELLMMAMLLDHGFNVFEELADSEGIDCGVLGDNTIFYPIQVKSRADFYDGNLVRVHNFPANLLVIIYDEKSHHFWIIPGDEYKKLSTVLVDDGVSYYRLTVKKKQPHLLDKYMNENGVQLLKTMTSSP